MKPKKSNVISFPIARKVPRPPSGLGKAGRTLWKSIQNEYGVDDAGGLAHLLAACRCEDDVQRLRALVSKDGDIVTDRFSQKHSHPLLSSIRALEQQRRQSLAALNLTIEPLKNSKPGRPSGS